MDGPTAASIAREAARGHGTYFTALSSLMCWDAVAACQGRPPGRYIDTIDEPVRDVATLRSIPEGATIGFFDRGTLAHVMISLGNGEAAGNKNSCVGIGEMVGWERHDLVPHMHGSSFGSRNLTLRFRRYI